MKTIIYLFFFILITACSNYKKVYWCGDHPCINNKEKENYFKKTMIVEIKNFPKGEKNISEIEKITNQSRLEEKKRIKEEKQLAKEARLEEKRRIQEEKQLAKEARLEEKRDNKNKKKSRKKIPLKNDKKIVISASTVKIDVGSNKFKELVEKVTKRNMIRSYPNINRIPE